MNLATLGELASQLSERYEALAFARSGLIPEAVLALTQESGISEVNIRRRLKRHCDAQVNIINKIMAALSSRAREFDHLIFFVTGSIAKLEYFRGASDVDLLAVTTSDRHTLLARKLRKSADTLPATAKAKKSSARLKAFANSRLRRLHDQAVLLQDSFDAFNNFWTDEIRGAEEVAGMTFCGGSYFYTAKDLLETVGKAHEPSWALIYRANLVFESAFFCRRGHTSRCTAMRDQTNDLYKITTGLMQIPKPVYPILGTLLLQILTRNGILAKIAYLKDPKSQAPAKVRKGTRQTELVKAISGRLWSSIIHLIMLHVLFWEAVLKPHRNAKEYLRETNDSLAEPPIYKIISIANKMELLRELVTNRVQTNPDDSLGFLDEANGDIVKIVYDQIVDNYKYLGCHGATTGGDQIPLIDLYTCFMLGVGHIRKNAPALPPKIQKSIIHSTDCIVDCITKCEKLTLYLMSRVAKDTDEISYLRYFGGTMFDRKETIEFFKQVDEKRASNGSANAQAAAAEEQAPALSKH
jgi:hypothetical protein